MSQRVTIDDVRRHGHCVAGAREWFARHDLDFRSFVRHGISEEDFLSYGDALAAEVVRAKRERLGG